MTMINEHTMTNKPLALSEKKSSLIIWTLLCLMPIVGMAVDLIAPSLPAIATDLQVSTKITKNIISIYLLGYAIGNFFTGFLTDAIGRQKLLRFGLLAFTVVSIIPVLFPHIAVLLGVRLLQGITLGAVAVLTRAICSDILPSEKLIRFGTFIGTMWGLGPVIGPLIGGYLQFYFGWKAGFCFFSLITLVGFILVYNIVPETNFARQSLNIKTIKKNFIEVITHRVFMTMVMLMGLVYSLMIVFNTLGPFLIQDQLHYSSIFFGHLALYLGLTFLGATFVCRYCLKKFKPENLFLVIIDLFFLIAACGVVISYFLSENIIFIAIMSGFMFFVSGWIFPMSTGKGLSLFRHIAGTASATMYFINILLTSLSAFLISFIKIQTAIPLMWIYFFLMLLSLIIYWSLIKTKNFV